ncbi:hypothetical protein [Duganella sp. CF458]|uniref:hypothetical protein n=1 Tax=Duganella sp. CF458 TaxID=1884368 RepID=UPI0027D8694D|nr:hypothetical protein [Duganella sp. CF458]
MILIGSASTVTILAAGVAHDAGRARALFVQAVVVFIGQHGMFAHPFFAGGVGKIEMQPEEFTRWIGRVTQPLFGLGGFDRQRLRAAPEQVTADEAALVGAIRDCTDLHEFPI